MKMTRKPKFQSIYMYQFYMYGVYKYIHSKRLSEFWHFILHKLKLHCLEFNLETPEN